MEEMSSPLMEVSPLSQAQTNTRRREEVRLTSIFEVHVGSQNVINHPSPPHANTDSITDLVVEPPTFLFIQMQLCQKESLKDWLASNVTNRKRETVIHYFEQVSPFLTSLLLTRLQPSMLLLLLSSSLDHA